jgi:hypothetical protein
VAGLPAGAEEVVERTLNLNADTLVAARFEIIRARKRQIAKYRATHHGLTAHARSTLAARFREESFTAEFGSTLASLAASLSP